MEIYEITGYQTGISKSGVNFLQPSDSFENIEDGFVYRQVLQSRQGLGYFAPRLSGNTRITGIFEYINPAGIKRLCATDQTHFYLYNSATGVFDQKAFGGTIATATYTTFGLTSHSSYFSGVAWPTKANAERFVFTCQDVSLTGGVGNISGIFYYDAVNDDIRDYANATDNTDYVAPASGTLTKGKYVTRYAERLMIVVPSIAGSKLPSEYVYTAIRDSGGSGDDFNTPGAGQGSIDTSQEITGLSQLGENLVLNANRSPWTLEKTGDQFNPLFVRQIPGVIGTNADFSAVGWSDVVKSLGKTGVLGTDSRQSLRVDNKIPDFTALDIQQNEFNMTYGGFDRENNQFLWSYLTNGSESTTQDAILVNNYEFDTWSKFNMRLSVFGQTDIGTNLTWDEIDETTGNESWATWDTTTDIWNEIGITEGTQKTLAGDDNGFIYKFNSDNNDIVTDITAITKAGSAVLTVGESSFVVGDEVVVSDVVGMTEINNWTPGDDQAQFNPYTVTAATATSITLNVDSTLFTNYTSGGLLSVPIKFQADTIPFNPYRSSGNRVFIESVEFLIDTNGGFLRVDVFDDTTEHPFIENVLCQPTSTTKAREWVTLTVNQEANFMSFRLRQDSPYSRLKITSMRIHASPGGLTSG